MAYRKTNVLPGFGLTLGYTLVYLSLIVLIPLGFMIFKVTSMTPAEFWKVAASERAVASYRLTFGASFIAASFIGVAGLLLAWVLTRYRFPGRRWMDALIDFPFALPTAVAGLTLSSLFSEDGWLGRFLVPMGIKVVYQPLGIVVALTFVSLPFVVRTVQPVLEELDTEVEEAAATLGAGRLRTYFSVVLPGLLPALLTGFALAFARAVGEYGSVVFLSSNRQFEAEITPFVIMGWLDQFEYANAIAVAVVMLSASFAILVSINLVERWAGRFQR
jgi:sulfate transport system permease protein